MDLALTAAAHDLSDPRAVLRRFGIRPKKSLGQHFLVDRTYLERIVEAAAADRGHTVLEVGPGLGILTDALAQTAGTVVAVELDARMRAILAETVGRHTNVTVAAADILNVDPAAIAGLSDDSGGRIEHYLVVANLPYYITSAVLRHILEARARPKRAVVMVQKEVAERILAQPGNMSVLAVAIQYYAVPRLVTTVPAAAFYPEPRVDSAVLALDVRAAPAVDVPRDLFFRTARAGFGQKRKQLRNSLAAGLGLRPVEAAAALLAAGIDPSRRAETLSLDEWATLTTAVESAQSETD